MYITLELVPETNQY